VGEKTAGMPPCQRDPHPLEEGKYIKCSGVKSGGESSEKPSIDAFRQKD